MHFIFSVAHSVFIKSENSYFISKSAPFNFPSVKKFGVHCPVKNTSGNPCRCLLHSVTSCGDGTVRCSFGFVYRW